MSAPLVADKEDLHECYSFCRYRGSHMCAPLVADKEEIA